MNSLVRYDKNATKVKVNEEKYDMHYIVFIRKWNFLKFCVEEFHDIQYNIF